MTQTKMTSMSLVWILFISISSVNAFAGDETQADTQVLDSNQNQTTLTQPTIAQENSDQVNPTEAIVAAEDEIRPSEIGPTPVITEVESTRSAPSSPIVGSPRVSDESPAAVEGDVEVDLIRAEAAVNMQRVSVIYDGGRAIQVEPLTGSEWAKANPGSLPYERCFIEDGTHTLGLDRDRTDFLVYGYSWEPRAGQAAQLVCYTKKLSLGYKIPIEFGSMQHIGVLLNLFGAEFDRKVSVHHLNGKTVEDLFGDYRGFETGIGLLFGLGGQWMKNSSGVRLANFQGSFDIGVNMNYVDLRLERRTNFFHPGQFYRHFHHCKEGLDPLVIVKGTQEPRIPGDWFRRIDHDDPNDPIRYSIDYTIDYTEMLPLKFVKVK